jgi:hypothetical protein
MGFFPDLQTAERKNFPDQMHSRPDLPSDLENIAAHFWAFPWNG